MANVVLGQGQPICWLMGHTEPARLRRDRPPCHPDLLDAMTRLKLVKMLRQGSNGPNADKRNEIHPGPALTKLVQGFDRSDLKLRKSTWSYPRRASAARYGNLRTDRA